MIYLESRDTRSDFNLALEQYLFDHTPHGESCFMLWQNRSAVIVGKYQNTEEEVNGDYVRRHGIQVTRRLSGGGAVYHDLGNLNYTFLTDGGVDGNMEFGRFCTPLIRALESVGVKAELNGRNDVTVEGRKISGSAQYRRGGRVMHHGTILYESDLSVLQKALHVSPVKLASKGVASVQSRVTNVREHMAQPLELEEFWAVLRRKMVEGQSVKRRTLQPEELEEVEQLRRNRYATWEWNWGISPESTLRKVHRIEGCGTVQIYLDMELGRIKECQFRGDFFGDDSTLKLSQALNGCRLEEEELRQALEQVDVESCVYRLTNEQLVELLIQ